ncbi:MAG: hypothetical protein HYW90_03045 [Candidatus Sungbacteria bacterium]|nr:hypothetical protein [Candidatus Sungbacteria bacterium]
MEKGKFKRILFEIFDELGFTEEEKQIALEGFKKKLARSLFDAVKGVLSEEEKGWVADHMGSVFFDPADPKVKEIEESVKKRYSKGALQEKSRQLFKEILADYIDFMSRELILDQAKIERLKSIAEEV